MRVAGPTIQLAFGATSSNPRSSSSPQLWATSRTRERSRQVRPHLLHDHPSSALCRQRGALLPHRQVTAKVPREVDPAVRLQELLVGALEVPVVPHPRTEVEGNFLPRNIDLLG